MKNKFSQNIKRGYDKIADTWNEKRDWYIEKQAIDEAITHIPKGASILDIGCGNGKPIAAYLIHQDFNVYGIEISPKQLAYAKQAIKKEQIFLADICEFKTELKFDAIICWFTLFHVHAAQHLEVLNKIYALLKPGGILLITFADTNYKPEGDDRVKIDKNTIESEMFGERFLHSGHPSETNTCLLKEAEFKIISDVCDQPGNQVILAKKPDDI
jgi:2-polyprenyl-3-methyl-5-hydroxy-6-metoxy-1,4-benzoquinol methylase